MFSRARLSAQPETLHERFGSSWAKDALRSNVSLVELYPRFKAYVIRHERNERVLDVMSWGVLPVYAQRNAGASIRDLGLPAWKAIAARPDRRCLVPLTEFCEPTPTVHQLGRGRPVKGEMWFEVPEQPIFAVAGLWRVLDGRSCFAMVLCDPNELVALVHAKAMVTILHEWDWDRWLRASYDEMIALQRPYPAGEMAVRGPVFPTRQG